MPAPRAVLADIHELKLNPRKEHTQIKYNGRLKKSVVQQDVTNEFIKENAPHLQVEVVSAATEVEVKPVITDEVVQQQAAAEITSIEEKIPDTLLPPPMPKQIFVQQEEQINENDDLAVETATTNVDEDNAQNKEISFQKLSKKAKKKLKKS